MPRNSKQHKNELRIMARMPRLARSKQCPRTGSLTAKKWRSRLPRTRYLANPASLIGIPRLEPVHAGNKMSFGSSALTELAQTLVEIDQANESDWIAAGKTPSTLVEHVLRRYLADRGQSTIAEHFELTLTLGEAIVDSIYGEAEPTTSGQLFFVLNTESSFALGVGEAITELEGAQAGMGRAFYDGLRQALYRWIRVYDDLDARERIEQMTEWAEGEDDPESYEIPKLEQDLPPSLKDERRSNTARSLTSFPVPDVPGLRELVEATIELHRVSHSMERPRVDEEWLERERHYHSLDLPLPAVLLYFRAGDAVTNDFFKEALLLAHFPVKGRDLLPREADQRMATGIIGVRRPPVSQFS